MTPQEWQKEFDTRFPDGALVSWMGPGDDYGDDDVARMYVPRIVVLGSGEKEDDGTAGSVLMRLHGPDAIKVSFPVAHIMEPYDGVQAPEGSIALRGTEAWFYVVCGALSPEMKARMKKFREDPEWAHEFVSPLDQPA